MHTFYKFIIINAVVLQLREWQTQRVKYILFRCLFIGYLFSV